MTYDLLIRNGRVIDGSGTAAFHGDVGIRSGKIAAVGKLRGGASRTIDVDGLAVAPGFLDTHCHYDAQVTWDPLCTFSCYHGATTVIIGNCSLALAPVRAGGAERLAEFLSYVEAIPIETLKTVQVEWESVGEYMAALENRLGINVGVLIGHTAVRHYVMQEESQGRAATPAEIEAMCKLVRSGLIDGALGFSISQNKGHYDPQGVHIPSVWADEQELFALADVLAELGTGILQAGGGREAERRNRLMTRLAGESGVQVIYNSLGQSVRHPDAWKQQIAELEATIKAGIRANPMCSPATVARHFTMRNAQEFRSVPTWHPISLASDEEKLRAYRDPEIRRRLHQEVVEWTVEVPGNTLGRRWYDYIKIDKTVLPKNKSFEGKSIREMAEQQGKGIIDGFLDLVVEENLDTVFWRGPSNTDLEAMSQILNCPYAYIGLSDSGAHVQFQSGYSYSSRLLGEWVRTHRIMSLERAVKRLTFENAMLFGLYDRGLLRPGFAADMTIFDPDTIGPLRQDTVQDFPAGAWRMRELAAGVYYTIVNGEVLIDHGRHTGALPGRVLRNWSYRERTQ